MESIRPRKLTEFLEIIWRWKLLIFLMATAMLIATFFAIKRVPNLYESRALVAIANQTNDDRLALGASFATLSQQLTSYANLVALIRRYGLYRPASDTDGAVERLRKDIKQDVKMRNTYPDGPETVTITYRYTDPVIAQRVVADLVAFFEQANATMRQQAATETGRLSEKITEVEDRLRKLGPTRDAMIPRDVAAGRIADDSLTFNARRLTATAIETLSDKEFALERQTDEQQRQITEQEKLIKSLPAAKISTTTSAYGVLLSRKAELQAQLGEMATQYTEKNPKVILVRTQLAEINRQIERFEKNDEVSSETGAAILSPEARELRASRRELDRLQTDLEITRRELNRKKGTLSELPEIESSPKSVDLGAADQSASIRTEYDRLISRHTWLLDKQDVLLKLIGATGPNSLPFQLIDAPRIPKTPVAPNHLMLWLLALGMAVGTGLVVAVLREAPQWSLIKNDLDVEYYLGSPVLALIPETFTPAERTRLRRMSAARWLALTLLASALIPVFIAILNRVQIFQILGNR